LAERTPRAYRPRKRRSQQDRRLRAELGEKVFSSWFGCLELDALADQDVYLSVPTKFLKSWIQSLGAERKAARRKCSKALAPILDIIRKNAGSWPNYAEILEMMAPKKTRPGN
jgi:DnaA N-terminal domain